MFFSFARADEPASGVAAQPRGERVLRHLHGAHRRALGLRPAWSCCAESRPRCSRSSSSRRWPTLGERHGRSSCLGVLALLLITWVTQPTKRRTVGPVLVLLTVISAVYFPLFWNKTGAGTLSQPARAVRSTVSPDPRDEPSNLYREQENANLELNIRQAGPLGKGFGLPINYALPIVDVSNFDPMIKFIPHNGGLWIWMRLGLQGEIAFWVMLGTACHRRVPLDSVGGLAGRPARRADRVRADRLHPSRMARPRIRQHPSRHRDGMPPRMRRSGIPLRQARRTP